MAHCNVTVEAKPYSSGEEGRQDWQRKRDGCEATTSPATAVSSAAASATTAE